VVWSTDRQPAEQAGRRPDRAWKGSASRAAVIWAVAVMAVAGCGNQTVSGPQHRAAATTTVVASGAAHAPPVPDGDWSQFDDSPQRSGVGPATTGITARSLHRLKARTVRLPGTVDASAVVQHGLHIDGRSRDVAFVTTSYGITLAIDAGTGRILWIHKPAGTGQIEGSAQITNSTPILDPSGRYIYVPTATGSVQKLAVVTGQVVWSARFTLDPSHEKLASSLNIGDGALIVVNDGFIGDIPPYQGHVAMFSLATGRLLHEFNSLCSNRVGLIRPASCPYSDSGIWGRAGAVVEPDGDILVTTSNGQSDATVSFNGRTNWSDSVLELSPALKLLHNWTPADQLRLTQQDLDLGSTSPALLPATDGLHLAVQGGKAGVLDLLNLDRLDGTTGPAGPRTGGQLQQINDPGTTDLFTAPAVWRHGRRTYVFVADDDGTGAYVLNAENRLSVLWSDDTPGTSPVVAGGLLYIYDPSGSLVIRSPSSGRRLDSLAAPSGHWNSPVVVGGRIILPVGSANAHSTSGALELYHLPGR
jgi:outer membrane protein assembly factor BamB